METAVRYEKDTANLAAAAGDDVLRRQCQGSVLDLQERYRRVAEGADLDPDWKRMNVMGFRDAGEKALTGDVNGGIISESPILSVEHGAHGEYNLGEYRASLQDRYDRGTETVKALYDKYIPAGGAVADGDYRGTPRYDSDTKTIRMNFAADAKNLFGAGTTWFHEHAHYIDDASGNRSQRNSFIKGIITDCRMYEEKIQHEYRLESVNEARQQVSALLVLQGVNTHGVQDIFGGTIGKPYPGAIAYHRTRYWQDYGYQGLCREAFAHMYEACFDVEKRSYLKYYLPTAWKEFETIMEEMLT